MSGLAPSLLLAPSASLPPSSADQGVTITGGSDGYTLFSTDPAYRRIDDILYVDAPAGGRYAFHGRTLTRREYQDARPGRLVHAMGAHHEQIERRATPNAAYDHAGACEATTTRDDRYDEEALLVLLSRI